MPISEGYKRIGPAWASTTVEDNRDDPTDADLTPTLALATGWDETYSTTNQPRRKVLNELLYRHDSAVLDVRNFGILPWDAAVDTLAGGIKQRKGVIQAALVDNGPSYGNPTDPDTPGQNVWSALRSGPNQARLPAPADLMSTPLTYLRLKFQWDLITVVDGRPPPFEYQLRWKQAGTMNWNTETVLSTSVTVTVPDNTKDIVAQARGVSSSGYGDWSSEYTRPKAGLIVGAGTGTPPAPLGLAGTAMYDKAVSWVWNVPLERVTRFELQTKQGGIWDTVQPGIIQVDGMQHTTTHSNRNNVQGRLRIVTQAGTSPWSTEVQVTGMLESKRPPTPANMQLLPRRPDHVKAVADIPAPWTEEYPVVTGWNYHIDNTGRDQNFPNHPNPEYEYILVERSRSVRVRMEAVNRVGAGRAVSQTLSRTQYPVVLPPHPSIATKKFEKVGGLDLAS